MRPLVVLAFAIAVLGCGGPAAPVPDGPDTITHAPTGVPLPPEQSGYTRVNGSVTEEGATARYEMLYGGEISSVVITILRNPEPPEKPRLSTLDPSATQEAFLENVVAEIEAAGADAEHRFIAYYDVPILRGDNAYFGKRAFFRTEEGRFLNAFIFEYEDWFIEYRVEFPRDRERNADQFVFDHSWGPKAGTDPNKKSE